MKNPPSIIAVIPARGGSKRIPQKNLLPIAGKPLIAHTIDHAKRSQLISEVIVSTDNGQIADVAKKYGAEVIMRPDELASDHATSESALIHVLDERRKSGKQDPDLLVFLQCTSPLRASTDIDEAIEEFQEANADSLLSVCPEKGLFWERNENGVRALNYNPEKRVRSQEWKPWFRENGSIFIMKPALLRKYNNRLAGNVVLYEMDEQHSIDIDTPADVERIEWIFRRQKPVPPGQIACIVFDFDGVMTDNSVRVSKGKIESVRCHRGDGWGIARVKEAGIPMLVLSTEKHTVVAERCEKLGIPCHQGIGRKGKYLQDYLRKEDINPSEVVFVGNDVNDKECLEMVGYPVVVADAHPDVQRIARWVTQLRGGHGAVREVCDWILGAQD